MCFALVCMYLNIAGIVLVFLPLVIVKLYSMRNPTVDAGWALVPFAGVILIAAALWIFAWIAGTASWIRIGNERTPVAMRFSMFSLPICVLIIILSKL